MKKALVILALLSGLVALARRFGPKLDKIDWQQAIERMPDDAPPKWMFRNISAIRENSDRILELLEGGAPRPS